MTNASASRIKVDSVLNNNIIFGFAIEEYLADLPLQQIAEFSYIVLNFQQFCLGHCDRERIRADEGF